MTKPMLVTLPFVLLLSDYWPLQRFRWWRLWCCPSAIFAGGPAGVLEKPGKLEEAVRHYRQALLIDSGDIEARQALEAVLAKKGKSSD